MLIALDYDDTYTADPDLWLAFIRHAHQRGHRVICATMRHEHELKGMCPDLRNMVEVFHTSRRAKLDALEQLGLIPDIWIDDSPHWLFSDAL